MWECTFPIRSVQGASPIRLLVGFCLARQPSRAASAPKTVPHLRPPLFPPESATVLSSIGQPSAQSAASVDIRRGHMSCCFIGIVRENELASFRIAVVAPRGTSIVGAAERFGRRRVGDRGEAPHRVGVVRSP